MFMEKAHTDREVIGLSNNGVEISYDPVDSHAATHLDDTPGLLELVNEIIPTIEVSQDEDTVLETDMGRVIGSSELVEVNSSDEIFYALRKNREKPITFVRDRSPVETSLVTVVIKPLTDGAYNLHSAWIGPLVPSVPGDEKETPESREFWNSHALVAGRQEIVPGTETTKCPW